MAGQDVLQDRVLGHAAMILRYREGEARRILSFMRREMIPDLQAQIAKRTARIDERGYDLGPWTTKRLDTLFRAMDGIVNSGYSDLLGTTRESLVVLARHEAEFVASATRAALPSAMVYEPALPSPALLRSIVTSRPFEGRVLRDWYRGQAKGVRDGLRAQVRLGLANGETTEQMARRAKRVMEGAIEQARAVVRTATNHTTNHTAMETMRENSEVYDGWEFLATLDSSTTFVCAGLDGKVFALDDASKLPPRHWGCRSQAIGHLKSYAELGFPDIEEDEPGQRASAAGPVSGKLDYQGWLTKMDSKPETRHYVEDALGPKRAKLWRQGVHVRKFAAATGEDLTLAQVAKRAGLPVPA
jgi:SPP1 gp7 family putative phage head morphogenesis protein